MPSQKQLKWSQLKVGLTVLIASITPVSYTHLSLTIERLGLEKERSERGSHLHLQVRSEDRVHGNIPRMFNPVSYTHLDVYKRQPL